MKLVLVCVFTVQPIVEIKITLPVLDVVVC